MEAHELNFKYVEWFSPDEMNENTKKWIRGMNFVRDEQYFFKNLLQKFSIRAEDSNKILTLQNLTRELEDLKKEASVLQSILASHKNKLDILLDGINQIEDEEVYKETHNELIDTIHQFMIKHHQLKKDLFKLVKRD